MVDEPQTNTYDPILRDPSRCFTVSLRTGNHVRPSESLISSVPGKLGNEFLSFCGAGPEIAGTATAEKRAGLPIVLLVILGFLMRLPGILFTGMPDLDQILLEWGAAVRAHGVGGGYHGIYGVITYAFVGAAFYIAEWIPRFWTGPYKFFEIIFEYFVLWGLWQISPARYRVKIAWLYWVNPWFALHGAWQGFWDGPHTLMGLLAVIVLLRGKDPMKTWLAVGAILAASGLFKPQGVVFFVIPAFIYLVFQYVLHSKRWLIPFILGGASILSVATILVVATGGHPLAIPASYAQLGSIMPTLSNNSLNIWRTITKILQWATNQSGPSYSLQLPGAILKSLHMFASAATMLTVVAICLRAIWIVDGPQWIHARSRIAQIVRWGGVAALTGCLAGLFHRSSAIHQDRLFGMYSPKWVAFLGLLAAAGILGILLAPILGRALARILEIIHARWPAGGSRLFEQKDFNTAGALLFVLALSAVAMPQFNTRMHINHAYSGLVFLIPFACANRKVGIVWIIMTTIHFICHLSRYLFGRASILPQLSREYPDAQELVSRLSTLQTTAGDSTLIAIQTTLNDTANRIVTINGLLDKDTMESLLSAILFCAVLWLLHHFLFARVRTECCKTDSRDQMENI